MVTSINPAIDVGSESLPSRPTGSLQVITYPHRTFLTEVFSSAMRIAAHGDRVLIVQFLKGGIDQGQHHPINLLENLEWIRCSYPTGIEATVALSAQSDVQLLWDYSQAALQSPRYHTIILDELCLAIEYNLIKEVDVVTGLIRRHRDIEVILTGPQPPASILELADQYTQIRIPRLA